MDSAIQARTSKLLQMNQNQSIADDTVMKTMVEAWVWGLVSPEFADLKSQQATNLKMIYFQNIKACSTVNSKSHSFLNSFSNKSTYESIISQRHGCKTIQPGRERYSKGLGKAPTSPLGPIFFRFQTIFWEDCVRKDPFSVAFQSFFGPKLTMQWRLDCWGKLDTLATIKQIKGFRQGQKKRIAGNIAPCMCWGWITWGCAIKRPPYPLSLAKADCQPAGSWDVRPDFSWLTPRKYHKEWPAQIYPLPPRRSTRYPIF